MAGLFELYVVEESEDGHEDEGRKKSYANDGMGIIELDEVRYVSGFCSASETHQVHLIRNVHAQAEPGDVY
jgi:hypothetical protein